MGFKVTVELDESKLKSQADHAAKTVQSEFQKIDPAGSVTKKSGDAFKQIEQQARTAGQNIGKGLKEAEKQNVFGRMAANSKSAFEQVTKHAQAAGSVIGSIVKNALGVFGGNLLTTGISRLTSAFTDFIENGIKYNSTLEVTRLRFKSLLGSAQAATQQLDVLKDLADSTPFTFPQLSEVALQLQAMGFNAKETQTGMRGLIDAAARAGGSAEQLQAVALILGQINTSGNLLTEDLKQLQQRGIPALEILAKASGKTAAEFRKAMSEGLVDAEVAARTLMVGFLSRPDVAGLSEEVANTLLGKISTLADKFDTIQGRAAEKAQARMKEIVDESLKLLEGPGAENAANRLSTLMAKPFEVFRDGLKVLTSNDPLDAIKDLGKDASAQAMDKIKETFASGFKLLKTEVIEPAMKSITDSVTQVFTKMKTDIMGVFESLKAQILQLFQDLKQKFGGIINFEGGGGGNVGGFQVGVVVQGGQGQTPQQWDRIIKENAQRPPLPIPAPLSLPPLLGGLTGRRGDEVQFSTTTLPFTGGGINGTQAVLEQAFQKTGESVKKATFNADEFLKATGKLGPLIRKTADDTNELTQAATSTIQTFFDSLIVGQAGVVGAFTSGLRVVQQAASQFLSQFVSKIFSGGGIGGIGGGSAGGFNFGGLFGGGSSGGGSAGSVGGGFNLGGLFGGLGNLFKTPTFIAGGTNAAGGLATITARQAGIGGSLDLGTAAAKAAGVTSKGLGGGLFGGIGGLAALLGPALLGGTLGIGLGGKSTTGRILGAIGGGAVGIGAALGASVGLAGGGLGFGLLAALGPIGLIGVPLLVGAILLGKASQRKKDEQAADAIWTDELNQTRALIAAVKSDRIEGSDALSQWAAIRQNTIAQLSQIKTKSVRDSRLQNQLGDLDRTVVTELRQAVDMQILRKARQQKLVPQFATGGVQSETGLALLHEGEVVLTRRQQASLGGARALAAAGVPGIGDSSNEANPASNITVQVALIVDDAEAAAILAKGVRQPNGRRAVVNVIKRSASTGEIRGV